MPTAPWLASGGFLPARGSWMLDFVVVAMVLVVVIMSWSICLVRYGRKYLLHKQIQLALGAILFLAVAAFEVDMRFVTDWRALADPSPYFDRDSWSPAWIALVIHLAFALPTTLLWIGVIAAALRRFPSPPTPCSHSPIHRRWGRFAVIGMWGTAVTGWIFYYMAFVAT